MSEQDLVNVILDWLVYQGAWAFRANSGVMPIEGKNGRRRLFCGAPAGTPDIIGIWPGGLGFGIECKVGSNKPTDLQKTKLEQINRCGGLAIVAYSVEDVENAFRERIKNGRRDVGSGS